METVALNNGTKLPRLGLGLWQVRNQKDCVRAVHAALEVGYRHFDTAQIYGNEAFVGKALAEVKRSDVFITTKIWNDNQVPTLLEPSFVASLEHLRTDYIDLLLVHFPVTETRQEAWKYMERIARAGHAKAIGVSNYTIEHLEELLQTCEIRPVVNQIELHVYLQQPELRAYCASHDIVVEAYSPLVHGHEMDNPVLVAIGKKYGKSAAQIMLRWCLEVGTVPLPKSVHADRIAENAAIFDFQLDAQDMEQLKVLDKNLRTCWDPTDVA